MINIQCSTLNFQRRHRCPWPLKGQASGRSVPFRGFRGERWKPQVFLCATL
jgi:hypothetical protein